MSQGRHRYNEYIAAKLAESKGKPEHRYWKAMKETSQADEDLERAFGMPPEEGEPKKTETWRDRSAQF